MSTAEHVVEWLVDPLVFLLLLGIVVRRRVTVCLSFSLYVFVVFTTDLLILIDPDRFYVWWFWLLKEALMAVLKFAIALELSVRIFRNYPGATIAARRLLLGILGLTLLAVLAMPLGKADYGALADELMPRVQNATAWLFTGIAGLILWFRLPVNAFAKAIVIGLVPYLLVFNIGLAALHSLGWELRVRANVLTVIAYATLTLYWNYVAWSREPAVRTGASQEV